MPQAQAGVKLRRMFGMDWKGWASAGAMLALGAAVALGPAAAEGLQQRAAAGDVEGRNALWQEAHRPAQAALAPPADRFAAAISCTEARGAPVDLAACDAALKEVPTR